MFSTKQHITSLEESQSQREARWLQHLVLSCFSETGALVKVDGRRNSSKYQSLQATARRWGSSSSSCHLSGWQWPLIQINKKNGFTRKRLMFPEPRPKYYWKCAIDTVCEEGCEQEFGKYYQAQMCHRLLPQRLNECCNKINSNEYQGATYVSYFSF